MPKSGTSGSMHTWVLFVSSFCLTLFLGRYLPYFKNFKSADYVSTPKILPISSIVGGTNQVADAASFSGAHDHDDIAWSNGDRQHSPALDNRREETVNSAPTKQADSKLEGSSCMRKQCKFYTKPKHRCTEFSTFCDHITCSAILEKLRASGLSRLIFVGDSTSEQLFSTLLCRLDGCNVVIEESTSESNHYYAKQLSLSIIYTKRGYMGRPPVFTLIAEWLKQNYLRKGDVLILNEGIHYRFVRGDGELKNIQDSMVSSSDVQKLQDLGVRMFWRETLAQHFATSSGRYEGPQKRNIPCEAIKEPAVIEERNSMVNRIMEKVGIPVISALKPSMLAFEQHLAKRNPGKGVNGEGATGVDCTHFCEPSPILAELMDLVFDRILSIG